MRPTRYESARPAGRSHDDPCGRIGEGGEKVGLVISGAAARGPYQAGVIAELLPALTADNQRPVVIFGTSSGGLNAALLAQFADENEPGESLVQIWENLEPENVFQNPLFPFLGKGLRLAARATLLPILGAAGIHASQVPFLGSVKSVLDTTPLRKYAEKLFDDRRVSENIDKYLVHSVGVAATFCPPARAAARTRLFVQGESPQKLLQDHAVEVVTTRLNIDHLLASAAIPVVFPPVTITDPEGAKGSYIDGGVRLNAPLAAALSLDVTRLVVVSGHSVTYSGPAGNPSRSAGEPDLAASLAISLRSVLNDGLTDDLLALGRRNQLVRQLARHMKPESLPYQCVPYRIVAPEDGQLAELAAKSFRKQHSGLRRQFTDPYVAINGLLQAGGDGIGPDELLSLIFFDRTYAREQIELGRTHARAALRRRWRIGPLLSFR